MKRNVISINESAKAKTISALPGSSSTELDVPARTRDDNWSNLLSEIAINQDRRAFAEFFEHFAPMIKGYFLGKSGSSMTPTMAEELIQEVMLKVWQKADKFDARKSAASTWLFTLARNTHIDLIRKQARHNTEPLETEEIWSDHDDNSPVTDLQTTRDRRNIRQTLAQLPNEQAQVVRKIYMEGKTHQVAAAELQLPLGTVKSRLRLALARMKLIFGQYTHEADL